MSNEPWNLPPGDISGSDPWDADLNTENLVSNSMFLPEPLLKAKLICIAVEDVPDSEKPCKKVTFKIMDGKYQDYIVTDFFYATREAYWRLREWYVASGYYTLQNIEKSDGNFKEEKHVDRSIRPHDCVGQTLMADCINGGDADHGFRARLKNMREWRL